MTLAKRRNVVYKILICFYEMFYRNFLSLNLYVRRGIRAKCSSLFRHGGLETSNWTSSLNKRLLVVVFIEEDNKLGQDWVKQLLIHEILSSFPLKNSYMWNKRSCLPI